MEVSAVDFDESSFFKESELPWEKVGKVALRTSSFVAGSTFIPALFKKRRVIEPQTQTPVFSLPMEVAETEEKPLKLPAPHCTPKEDSKVKEIFTTTAKGGWTLVRSGLRLMRLGDQIDHIHPFSFLLAAPKDCVRKIFHEGGSLAKSSVIGGIVKGMEREYRGRNLERYIPSFAQEMTKEPEEVRNWIRARDWRGLVRYLYDLRADAEF